MTFDKEYVEGKSEKDKYLLALYDSKNGLSDVAAAKKIGSKPENIKAYRSRSGVRERIQKCEKGYVLTSLARAQLERSFLEWRDARTKSDLAAEEMSREKESEFGKLDLTQQIELWTSFIESCVLDDFLKNVREGRWWVHVDYGELARFSPELADSLLERPKDVLKAGEVALSKMDVPSLGDGEKARICLFGIPESSRLSLRDIRVEHLDKLYTSVVDVDQVSAVRPQIVAARFECPSCGNIIPTVQLSPKWKEPSGCGCGRKGKFRVLSKDREDSASVIVREPLAETLGSSLERKTMRCLLLGKHLTHAGVMDRMGYGKQLRVVFVPVEVPVVLSTGGQSTRCDIVLEVVGVSVLDEYTFNLSFSRSEVEGFREAVGREGFLRSFADSVFFGHYGDDRLKEALVAQLVADDFESGRKDERLHILIAGDPGTGKSTNLMGRCKEIAPIVERAVGKQASVPGLTARSDKKDEFTGQYIPEPGVLPKANKGLVIIDELDKMSLEAQPCLNEATSEGTVTIAKAGSHLELPAGVCLLAGANPSSGRYDRGVKIHFQLQNIDETVRDRCVVFPVFDTPDLERDGLIADRVLGLQSDSQVFDDVFLRRFVVYARACVRPVLRREEAELIKSFFTGLRGSNPDEVAIGTRQLPKLRALTLLCAKLHLRDVTVPGDFVFAKRVVGEMLRAFGVSEANLHVSRTSLVVPERVVLSFLRECRDKGLVTVPVLDLVGHCKGVGVTESAVRTAVAKLCASRDVFEPKSGFVGVVE